MKVVLLFVGILLLLWALFSPRQVVPVVLLKVDPSISLDPQMADIQVPLAPDSHPLTCSDNNIPGLLPGPRFGETLGLQGNLDLREPQHGPIMEI